MGALEVGERVWVEHRNCGAVVEEIGTNSDYPGRVLVRYDRVLVADGAFVRDERFGREWVLPEWLGCCACGRYAAGRVLASTTPGSSEGRLFWLYLCGSCYEREGWAEADLAGERDAWELSTGSSPDA